MEKLVILDYTKATIDFYDIDIDSDVIIDEEYISNLGYNINNCSWMVGYNMEITYHKEVLK